MKIDAIKRSHIKSFFIELDKKHKRGYVKTIYTLLLSVFKMCVIDDVLLKSPITGILAELPKEKKEKRHALTKDEQRLFLQFIKNSAVYDVYYNLFVVFLGTGARAGELLGLRWENIDFDNNVIHITHQVTYRMKNDAMRFCYDDTKTDKANRDIPLFDDVKKALKQERQKQFMLGGCKAEIDGYNDFVFTNSVGNLYSCKYLDAVIRRAVDRYNTLEVKKADAEKREPLVIRQFSLHNLRHTFATWLCMNESNLKYICDVMGHTSIATTMDIYAEVNETTADNTYNKLNAICHIG